MCPLQQRSRGSAISKLHVQVLKRGFLNVKGRQVKKWKKCWVKVQDGVFCYYNESEAPVSTFIILYHFLLLHCFHCVLIVDSG